jgi:integrin beta 3
MERSQIAALAKGLVPFVREVVAEAVVPLAARIAELEARPVEKGDAGPPGPQGQIGDRGEKGDQGRDGRDAADLMLIYSHITEQVTEVVAGALKTFSINSPDSGRTLQAGFGSNVHQIKTGIPLDAGVWTERTYAAGDSVSHGGSSWIAQKETSAKPGKSDDWRLAVKRGADGRDYRPDDKRATEPVRFK